MDDLILIGGGGHCASVIDSVMALGAWNLVGVVDSVLQVGTSVLGVPVVGDDEALAKLRDSGVCHAAITVGSTGDCGTRVRLAALAQKAGFLLPCIVDGTATVSRFADISDGAWIGKHAIVNARSRVGFCSIVNTGSVVEHDATVGEFAHVSVGAVLCGGSSVGAGGHVGPGAIVVQGVRVGEHAVVGAGGVVLTDVPNHTRVAGIPAREMGGRGT